MKIILNIVLAAVVAVLALAPAPASAYTWFTEDALLASYFPGATPQVTPWVPSATQAAAFKAAAGYALPALAYNWYRVDAASGGGFALVDEQLGQHEPITFGVKLRPGCVIERIEIMVYREAYGEGVRAPAFREQFIGRTAKDTMRVGKDIQIVSGATVSSRALAVGARRAAVLCEVWSAG